MRSIRHRHCGPRRLHRAEPQRGPAEAGHNVRRGAACAWVEAMTTQLKGMHHVTLCPGNGQEDLDFFTEVLGQRLVKQTVLMDGRIPIYHLYYGNADADVGSIATSFPYSRKSGRRGSGQI